MTDFDRIRWAVAFSQIKLDELRPGDVLNLRDDLWNLTGRSDDDAKEGFFQKLTIEELGAIQTSFRKCFEQLTTHNSSKTGAAFGWELQLTKQSVYFTIYATAPSELFHFFVYSEDPLSAVNLALANSIANAKIPLERFRRCPECQAMFVLSRKPDQRDFFCSPRCAGKAATRRSRKGNLKTKSRKPGRKK